VLLAVKNMGGESTEAWRAVLDDLIKRGLQRPEFLIVDGALGLETAIAAVWNGVAMQRCTVGSLKKSGRNDSVIANDSRSAEARCARAQGAKSTGIVYHWIAAATHS